MLWLYILIAVAAGYLLGNVNGAICASKLLGDDVRKHGSGNAGLTNFIRSYGASHSAAVIIIDAGKAALACLIGGLLLKSEIGYTAGAAIGGTSAMLGHVFPVFYGFHGGKGILSGLFIALMTDWRIAVIGLSVFAIFYFCTQYVSLGSVLGATAFAIGYAVFQHDDLITMICGIFMGTLAVVMHYQNIIRLFKGQERKTNLFQKNGQ